MKDEMKRMNKGFMRKDGKFFLPITHESLVVDNDGVSINKKYLSIDGLAGYATEAYVQDAILQAQLGEEVDLSKYATVEDLDKKADKSEIPFVDVNKSYVDEQIAGHTHDEYATQEFVEEKIAEIDLSQSHVHENKAVLDSITLVNINSWDSKSDFSGDYEDLTNKPNLEGFATQAYVDEAVAGLDAVEGPQGPKGDQGEQGPQGPAGKDGVDGVTPVKGVDYFTEEDGAALNIPQQPNFKYEIKMVAAGEEAKVETIGEYPNLTIILNIPLGAAVAPEPDHKDKMWIGWIPFDQVAYDNGVDPTMGYSDPNHVNEYMTMEVIQFGLDNGSMVELKPQVLDKYEIKSVKEAGFVACVYPTEKDYVVTFDDGFGGKRLFDDANWQVPQNGLQLVNEIDGTSYSLSGGMAGISGTWYLYVDEK